MTQLKRRSDLETELARTQDERDLATRKLEEIQHRIRTWNSNGMLSRLDTEYVRGVEMASASIQEVLNYAPPNPAS